MKCETCGTEYKVLRDQDDNLLRHICACEAVQPCHQCKRGKVNHAQLTRAGEVANYACAKHGSPDAVEWSAPDTNKPSAGRVAAEAIVDGKLKVNGKKAPKASELVTPKAPPKSPYGKLKEKVRLYEATCAKCVETLLTSRTTHCCPNCGVPMELNDLGGAASVDGAYIDSGPRGTSTSRFLANNG